MALTSKLSAIGDAIRSKSGTTELMTLDAMPAAIEAIQTGGSSGEYFTDEDLTFSGDLSYMFANDNWKKVLEQEQSRAQIKDATNLQYLFNRSSYEDLSWLTISSDGSTQVKLGSIFKDCTNLKKIPAFRNILVYTNQSGDLFSGCYNLNDTDGLVDFFKNIKFSASNPQSPSTFYYCYSLRNVDAIMPHWITAWETYNKNAYVNYWCMFDHCYALDELNGVYVNPYVEVSTNRITNIAKSCPRLKNFTFRTNEDGTPLVVSWKSQTLDLTGNVGSYHDNYGDYDKIYSYNSGITADKEVTDAASYEALKNDPDWWTRQREYCRFNHDSAVNTINSLPDTSAYGTNIVKFNKDVGSATDGGAISTLTEAEIAVAAAKGWTVTLA